LGWIAPMAFGSSRHKRRFVSGCVFCLVLPVTLCDDCV
jgi:hypothetical protein